MALCASANSRSARLDLNRPLASHSRHRIRAPRSDRAVRASARWSAPSPNRPIIPLRAAKGSLAETRAEGAIRGMRRWSRILNDRHDRTSGWSRRLGNQIFASSQGMRAMFSQKSPKIAQSGLVQTGSGHGTHSSPGNFRRFSSHRQRRRPTGKPRSPRERKHHKGNVSWRLARASSS